MKPDPHWLKLVPECILPAGPTRCRQSAAKRATYAGSIVEPQCQSLFSRGAVAAAKSRLYVYRLFKTEPSVGRRVREYPHGPLVMIWRQPPSAISDASRKSLSIHA